MTKPAPGRDQPPIPVRLVTFNIRHGVGDDDRLDRHYGARSEDVDQPLLLSRALDMQLAWGPAIEKPRGARQPDQEYGNALLSRLPVLISDVHPLPGDGEPRSALRTLLELNGGT